MIILVAGVSKKYSVIRPGKKLLLLLLPVLSKVCLLSTDLRNQMEQQRGCPLTKLEKKVFLKVQVSLSLK